jgi:hypothetical protein
MFTGAKRENVVPFDRELRAAFFQTSFSGRPLYFSQFINQYSQRHHCFNASFALATRLVELTGDLTPGREEDFRAQIIEKACQLPAGGELGCLPNPTKFEKKHR